MSSPITSLPVVLDEPGHYVLEESLSVEAGEYAIKVTAERVEVDLQGHSLGNLQGTTILLEATHFTLRNGTLQGRSIAIVSSPHIRPDHCHLCDLKVEGVLYLGGDHLLAERCTVRGATQGIRGGLYSKVHDCKVSGALLGVEVGAGSEILRTQVTHCEEGVYAYGSHEKPVRLEKLLIYECERLGLRLDGPGIALRCEVHNNGKLEPAGGILAGPASVVQECEAYGNQGGDILVVDPCELRNNRVSVSEKES